MQDANVPSCLLILRKIVSRERFFSLSTVKFGLNFVESARQGSIDFVCFQIKRNQIRKGMFLVDERLKPTACWEFEGEILVLHHPTTISPKYQAMGKKTIVSIITYLVDKTLKNATYALTLSWRDVSPWQVK